LTSALSSRCSALAVLVLLLTGCYTWQPYEHGPMLIAGESLPHSLRATRRDSTQVTLTAPFLRSDTLFGHLDGDTVAVPVPDIARVQRLGFSTVRTLGLVLVPAAALGLTYLIVCGERGCESHY
jgi:hypothetical protein